MATLTILTQPSLTCGLILVNDAGHDTSELLHVDPKDGDTANLVAWLPKADVEALAMHPITKKLYATGSDENGDKALFLVETSSIPWQLSRIGSTEFEDVDSLSFFQDGTLVGIARGQAIIRIDLTTGHGSIIYKTNLEIEEAVWSADSTKAFLTVGATPWLYEPSKPNPLSRLAQNFEFPGRVEALTVRPDGKLVVGVMACMTCSSMT